MSTIDELMEGKKPGEIKISSGDYTFIPYCKTRGGNWGGLTENKDHKFYSEDDTSWRLYTEPKKMIKRWLWRYKLHNKWYICNIYQTDAEAKEWFEYPPVKIEHTEIEVEVD